MAAQPDTSVDIAFLVALKEEFRVLQRHVVRHVGEWTPIENTVYGSFDYYFEVASSSSHLNPYKCIAYCIDDMGKTPSSDASHRLLTCWQPRIVVNIGIAGSLAPADIRLGDIIVAEQVNDYLAKSKATKKSSADWGFDTGGDSYRSPFSLVRAASMLEFSHIDSYRQWRQECADHFATVIPDESLRARLIADSLIQEQPLIEAVHLASGDAVAAAQFFRDWVRRQDDRNDKAIEMEAGSMLGAAYRRRTPPATLVLRGISDLGDEDKSELDALQDGAIRQLAMGNAVRLAWTLLSAGVFAGEHEAVDQSPESDVPPKLLFSLSGSQGLRQDAQLGRAYASCIGNLLTLQYPWGEWSDRRTAFESQIAERAAIRGPTGPKPNVARTLFGLEALLPVSNLKWIRTQWNKGFEWLLEAVVDDWYKEWAIEATDDSESIIPTLFRRPYIRHTAQVAGALARWTDERDPLAAMALNVTGAQLENGFWAYSPNGTGVQLLASVYAVEALGHLLSRVDPAPLSHMLGRQSEIHVQQAFRKGVASLHEDADRGSGLLGTTVARPSSYLTGLALFRLSQISLQGDDLSALRAKLSAGLCKSRTPQGWADESAGEALQKTTVPRSTLRVCAGLALHARNSHVPVDGTVTNAALDVLHRHGDILDSPDFACAAIALNGTLDKREDYVRQMVLEDIVAERLRECKGRWIENFKSHIASLNQGIAERISGFDTLNAELERRVHLLQRI